MKDAKKWQKKKNIKRFKKTINKEIGYLGKMKIMNKKRKTIKMKYQKWKIQNKKLVIVSNSFIKIIISFFLQF